MPQAVATATPQRIPQSSAAARAAEAPALDLQAMIRRATQQGDTGLLAKLAELMLNQSATSLGSTQPAAASQPVQAPVAGAKARLYGLPPAGEAQQAAPAESAVSLRRGDDSLTPLSGGGAVFQRAYRQKLDDLVSTAARKYGVDRDLLRAVVTAESDFDPKALSPAGAMGLMQLMPETASDMGVRDPWDPEQNIEGGARYLSGLLERYDGNPAKALAAYNWGPGNLERGGELPGETMNYVEKVLRLRKLYATGFSARA